MCAFYACLWLIDLNPVVPDLRRDPHTIMSLHDDVRGLVRHVAIDALTHNRAPLLRKQSTALHLMTRQTFI